MTIFDVIRYPMSDIPTVVELEALPKRLFDKWVSRTEWGDPRNMKGAREIGEWYEFHPGFVTEQDREELRLLKKMILEYGE